MQSIFRLPWYTDQIAPKMQAGKASLDSMRASPVMDMPVLNKLKRKRTDSPEPSSPVWVPPAKKPRPESEALRHSPLLATRPLVKSEPKQALTEATPQIVSHNISQATQRCPGPVTHTKIDHQTQHHDYSVLSSPDADATKAAPQIIQRSLVTQMADDVTMVDAHASALEQARDMTPLKQAIENEFNMQILMKHNELRLIEQELSKCQIALEQLRRCELLPYPGAQQLSASVSADIGPSVAPPTGYTRPTHAAPYGVVDGPYASHYRQWLLHDPQFESVPEHAASFTASQGYVRSTRNAGAARKSIQKSSTMPSKFDPQKSLPNYSTSGRKNKMAILHRSTDGQYVKLVCSHCHRSDFSNCQGFLNHCRIAHKVDYKSHEHAAVDCGQVLDANELASMPPEALATPVHKPSASRSVSTSTAPFKPQGVVHPLNSSGDVSAGVSFSASSTLGHVPKRAMPASGLVPLNTSSSPLQASSQAPRLSAQFAKYNMGGNFEAAVASARQKVDLGAEEEISPGSMDSASPLTPAAAGARTVIGSSRAGSLAPPGGPARPPSRKGYRQLASRPRPSPLMQSSGSVEDERRIFAQPSSEIPESPQDRSLNLSPHTVESNPGLVSDHEDDDHGSASEDEVSHAAIAHSLGVGGRDCSDSMDVDVRVDEGMEEHGVIIRRNSMLSAEDRGPRTAGSSSGKLGVGDPGA